MSETAIVFIILLFFVMPIVHGIYENIVVTHAKD